MKEMRRMEDTRMQDSWILWYYFQMDFKPDVKTPVFGVPFSKALT